MKCGEEYCDEFRFDENAALAVGWIFIEDQLYCPLHAPLKALQVIQAGRLAEVAAAHEARRVAENEKTAKAAFSTQDYAAWEEFQQQLRNFHRKHKRPAPQHLRLMSPQDWQAFRRTIGPIDVELEVSKSEMARKMTELMRSKRAEGI